MPPRAPAHGLEPVSVQQGAGLSGDMSPEVVPFPRHLTPAHRERSSRNRYGLSALFGPFRETKNPHNGDSPKKLLRAIRMPFPKGQGVIADYKPTGCNPWTGETPS